MRDLAMFIGTGTGRFRTDIGQQGASSTASGGVTSYAHALKPRHPNRVLASLPQSDFAALAGHLHVLSLTPGQVLIEQDHPLSYLYFPHDGLLSLLTTTTDGETVEAASVGRGSAICALHRSEFQNAFFTAVALGPIGISRIPAAHMQIAQAESKALDDALEENRKKILLQWRQNLACHMRHDAQQRVARWLLEAADRLEMRRIQATQEQVAQRLALRRTTVTLMARKLQDLGAIRWGRSRVEIVDRVPLESMACTCYASLRSH